MPPPGPFGRDARLTRKADYDRVFADAVGAGSRFFRVLGRRNGGIAARLGLIVSRKVDRRAIGRNRIKRIVREHFRAVRPLLADWDLVVLARPEARDADNGALRAALERCLKRFQGAPPTAAGTSGSDEARRQAGGRTS